MTTHDIDRAFLAFKQERTQNLKGAFDPSWGDLDELEAEAFYHAVDALLASASEGKQP
jgi:hypothetical protein